ncbi:MAG TPA: proline dehydrogenase family protein, partial [Methyloceanibacter sp.]|nr:proline dehydrogenase family protein [Methyloceanibacter sp.]
MENPSGHPGPGADLPTRRAISDSLLADEDGLVEALIARARVSPEQAQRIEALAARLVEAARAGRKTSGGVDSFLHEYGLSSEEGVLLLCLAEALLRIPDSETADRLIAETVGSGDWAKHLDRSDSLLVNASTWGLMLTGRLLDWSEGQETDVASMLQRLIARSGEPLIRSALRQAMRILGGQFVLGQTIGEALDNAGDEAALGYRFSFDMLGEAARTRHDAERYAERYERAAEAIAAWAGVPPARSDHGLAARPGLSVKLSALHPRYRPAQSERLRSELLPRLARLAHLMRDAWLPLTIDAEEADKLDLSLELLELLFVDPSLDRWNGLGLAVQAYSKRALPLI